MAGQGVVDDMAPVKHSLRVDWFQRDPGGSTIFVAPAQEDGVADVDREGGDGVTSC
jgi:hypothetical protein